MGAENEGNAFSGLIDEVLDPPAPGEGPGAPGEKATVSKEDYDALQAKLNDVIEKVPDQGQLKTIIENNGKLEQMMEVLVPNKDKNTEAKRKALIDEFDADPISFLDKKLDEKLSGVVERLDTSEVNRFADKVMTEIDRDYVLDWAKDGQKVADELAKFSTAYKREDPKAATIKAMSLAGVGKKRDAAANFPYYESSDYTAIQEKAMDDEATAYKNNLRSAAKDMSNDGLKGFFQK